jgi:ankyrin repeat protein
MGEENDYMPNPKKTPTEELYDLCKQNEENLERLTILLDSGANVNQVLQNGDTCLCIACNKGYENIVKFLLEHHANVNLCRSANSIMSTNISGVMSARRRSRYGGSSTSQTNSACVAKGDSPLNLSLKYGFENIALILIDNGAELCDGRSQTSMTNIDFDKSAIHEAIRLNCFKAVDKLLKTIYEKNDYEAIDWLFIRRYDLLRHVFINENIEIIRIVIPYILKRNYIEGLFTT